MSKPTSTVIWDTAMKNEELKEHCQIETLISAISGRWKLLIIYWLASGSCRFNELQRKLGRITHRTLTRQLTELREIGFVARKDFQTIPPHVEYSLTPLGQSLIPLLYEMHGWAAENADKLPAPKAPPG
jgi:DNA-binding HxlR family transcriptional regulator